MATASVLFPNSAAKRDKATLVERIKGLQRSSQDIKQQWWQYCQRQGSCAYDPSIHDERFLEGFLTQLETGAVCPGEESRKFQMIVMLKEFQQSSPGAREAWNAYCKAQGVTNVDPARHDEQFLRTFLEGLELTSTAADASRGASSSSSSSSARPFGGVGLGGCQASARRPEGSGRIPAVGGLGTPAWNPEAAWAALKAKGGCGGREAAAAAERPVTTTRCGALVTSAAAAVPQPNDWICPRCSDLQFKKNIKCRRCGTPQPKLAAAQGPEDSGSCSSQSLAPSAEDRGSAADWGSLDEWFSEWSDRGSGDWGCGGCGGCAGNGIMGKGALAAKGMMLKGMMMAAGKCGGFKGPPPVHQSQFGVAAAAFAKAAKLKSEFGILENPPEELVNRKRGASSMGMLGAAVLGPCGGGVGGGGGKMMTEEEARQFQESLKRRR